jgi:hypothetical protein
MNSGVLEFYLENAFRVHGFRGSVFTEGSTYIFQGDDTPAIAIL